MSKIQIALLCVLGFITVGQAQWQPLPPEDMSLSSIYPAVRADTSRKADGKVVDTDTLAGTVNIRFEGYYDTSLKRLQYTYGLHIILNEWISFLVPGKK